MRFIKLTLLLSFLFIWSCQKEASPSKETTGTKSTAQPETLTNFEWVSPDKSGIHFVNKITHSLKTKENLFDFDFFYNGAGVGVEDINNDGLKDIFFCGNQEPNRLYLNKGNMVFEDITEKAGINVNKQWSNGVTFADVNNDGWMDIYVSQGGPREKDRRKNLLFINQKDNTFKEMAGELGLDDHGISTQSAFFDYDKDGDLDCVVMNENDYYGVDPENFYRILKDKNLLKENSSHFYENRNGKFIDVTEKAGLLRPSFGLGLIVSDINRDGWPDIYMTNDYYVPDAMFINNGDGSFTDRIKETTNQITFYGMGVDIGDINNDNRDDIFVLDMASSDHVRSKTLMASMNVPQFNMLVNKLKLQPQFMYNSFQLNMGNNRYHNIVQLLGLAKTDWSWAGLIFDTDNDGNDDIYVSNGYRRYGLDNDIRMEVVRTKRKYKGKVPLEVKEAIYNKLPQEKLSNLLFRNHGNLKLENITSTSGMSIPSFSNGAAYADLDNDGDLDIVVNNMDDKAFLFRNLSAEQQSGNFIKIVPKGKVSENFAKVEIEVNGQKRTKESKRVRGYYSAVDNTVHFGLGNAKKIERLRILWPSGYYQELSDVNVNQTLELYEKDALKKTPTEPEQPMMWAVYPNSGIDFVHKENPFNDFQKEVLLPYKQSTQGPGMAKGDVNGDGLDDLFIGGAFGQAGSLYIQTSKGFVNKTSKALKADTSYEDVAALFVDIDNDGDLDLYVVSGGSEFTERAPALRDRIYLNDGKGNLTKRKSDDIDPYTIAGKSITKIDFDKDGDFDLIVGNRIKAQHYPLHEPSLIYRNDNGILVNVTEDVAPEFEDFGMINKVITTDFNNDGWPDFIAVGEWTGIGIFLNEKGSFKNIASKSKLDEEKGWWFTITETDVNNDGKKDYIVGNVGKNIKFKVSKEKPLRVYATDFDDNGTHDVVLSYKYHGKFVPARGKECSTMQMPFISKKMPTYNQFAHSTLEDIYGDKIFTAYRREANNFYTVLLINKGDGNFEMKKLPNIVQTMPVLDAATADLNGDGFEDVVVVGDLYNTEVETPRLDNPYALVLLSNHKDGYKVVWPAESGLYIDGNAKSVELIKNPQGRLIAVVGINNGKTAVFELKN